MKPTYVQLVNVLSRIVWASPQVLPELLAHARELLCLADLDVEPAKAARPADAGPCAACGCVPGVLSETLTSEPQQDQQAAAPPVGEAAPFDAEMALRREWWLGHGHSVPSLYGDDGEMQCHECRVWDYRRAPMAELDDQVRTTRLHRAAAALAAATAATRGGMSVAEQLARLAHRGQTDKAGRPYIEHVERVVARVRGDLLAEAVAWLHDVVEDTMFTEDTLAAFVDDPDVRGAVCLLTRDKTFQSYQDYIEGIRASGDALALKVKLADLRDHLDNPGCPDTLRPRYEAALAALSPRAQEPPR